MRKAFVISLLAFLSFSCNPASKFRIVEVSEPAMNGLTSIHGRAVVENCSGKKFMIEDAVLDFRYKNRELASARLMLPVEMPASAVSAIRYDLKLESESLSNLQTLTNRMETNPTQVFVDVTAYVRYGRIRRKVEVKAIPYVRIITNFEELK